MRYAISYVSSASKKLDDSEVEEVLKRTQDWNNEHDVTGLLLYSEGNFFQIIEGEKNVVKDLFESIERDPRHQNLIKIFERDIHRESFDGYESDFVMEETKYDSEKVQSYLNHIKVLDPASQESVKNILAIFLR